MFQFAFGLAASMRLGTDFAMNDELLRPVFRLGSWPSPARRIGRSVRFHYNKRFAPAPVVKIDNQDDPDVALAKLANGVHYAGFFQSERYFEGAETPVRRGFEFQPHHVERFRARYGDVIGAPYACCHVRRTDYTSSGFALPVSYYEECLRLAQLSDGTPVVFVGDDLEEVGLEFGERPAVRLEQNDEAVDLQLLANATVVVTSNSSFGWWGSWLGIPGRRVYAPQYWLGFRTGCENPRAVIPPGWHQVPVSPN